MSVGYSMTERRPPPGENEQGCWAIDDAGYWHDLNLVHGDFSKLCTDARLEFNQASLFYMGMVIVTVSSTRIIVRWSISNIDSRSLEHTIAFLRSRRQSPKVTIEYFFGAWERRTVSDAGVAAMMLESADRLRFATPIIKPFVKAMELADIADAHRTIRKGYQAWLLSEGRLSRDPEGPWQGLMRRALVFGHDYREESLVYRYLGRQAALIRVKGRRWARSVIGKSCGRALDATPAGDVLSDVYDRVVAGFEPRFDHVRACIPRADNEVEWVSY